MDDYLSSSGNQYYEKKRLSWVTVSIFFENPRYVPVRMISSYQIFVFGSMHKESLPK